MEFYVLKVVVPSGDYGLASKHSSRGWEFGHKGFDPIPALEHRLSLKDAKLGIRAISNWKSGSKGLKFEIVKYKIDIEEVIL